MPESYSDYHRNVFVFILLFVCIDVLALHNFQESWTRVVMYFHADTNDLVAFCFINNFSHYYSGIRGFKLIFCV